MRLECRHEWELEGDLNATIDLHLEFDAVVTPQGIQELHNMKANVVSITFGLHRQTLKCDGLKMSTALPIGVSMWFETRWIELWCRSPHLWDSIRDKMEEQATQRYFEELAA